MTRQKLIINDDQADDISAILSAMTSEASWTKRKAKLKAELLDRLAERKYISFTGCHHRYGISRVGESYLYDVPLYQQGALKPFRGKRVRLVCVRSGRYKRGYMAGVVADTPRALIVSRLAYDYSFPEHVLKYNPLYRSRRYLVIQPEKSIRIEAQNEPDGCVDLEQWDAILFDGRDGLPKCKFRHNPDGTVTGAGLGWRGGRTHDTLRESVKHLTKRGLPEIRREKEF